MYIYIYKKKYFIFYIWITKSFMKRNVKIIKSQKKNSINLQKIVKYQKINNKNEFHSQKNYLLNPKIEIYNYKKISKSVKYIYFF